ncbi:MAG: RNA polymerase sigma factor [Maritimibacter sp.]
MDRRERAFEAYLVSLARSGDRRAVGQLVALRGPRLFSHAVRLLREVDGAQDVTQDAWAEILKGLPRLRDEAAFLPWALRIVTRRVALEIKQRQRGRTLSDAYAQEAPTTTPEAGPERVDAAKIRAAIKTLPPEQGAAIALFYLEDLSVADVAMALDVPIGTIKTRLMHARRKLRDHLEGETNGQA